jgi:tetratricopeptide (TPR) repeat protein
MKPLLLLLAATMAASLNASEIDSAADSEFAAGNKEFAAGRYGQAIERYDGLVRSGKFSASLFYNLGNAWSRNGDLGRAILNYERALALDPHHPEATTNLRIVRDQARALELTRLPAERWFAALTVNQDCVVAAIAFWVALFTATSISFARRRSGRRAIILALALIALLVSVFAIYTAELGARGRRLAIVTAKKIEARLATADTSNSVLTLPPGSEIDVLSIRGEWIYAALPNRLRGWIPASSIEQVRL